jgi:hypothetical protein
MPLHLTYDWLPEAPDPAGIPWTLWQRDYAPPVFGGATWPGTASAGLSGARNMYQASEGANSPVVGGTLNGHPYAHYDGASDILTCSASSDSVWGAAATTGFILFRAPAVVSDPGTNDRIALWADLVAPPEIAISSVGITTLFNDGAIKHIDLTHIPNTWQLIRFRWDSSLLTSRITGSGWHSTAMGSALLAPTQDRSGCNVPTTLFFEGDIAEIMFTNTALSDAETDAVVAYLTARYGIVL